MAGGPVGGDRPQRGKKGGGIRRPKRRIAIRIDMTPMVDIAFLLLIFYMVTTVFSMPQAMEVNLPPKEEDDTKLKIKESNVLTLHIDENDRYYWNIGRDLPVPMRPDCERCWSAKIRLTPNSIRSSRLTRRPNIKPWSISSMKSI
jgi:hypothetical protein